MIKKIFVIFFFTFIFLSSFLYAKLSPVLSSRYFPTIGVYHSEYLKSYMLLNPDLQYIYNNYIITYKFKKAKRELLYLASKTYNKKILSQIYTFLGYISFTSRDIKNTIKYLNKAISYDSLNAFAYYLLANEYFADGKNELSRKYLHKAIKANPYFIAALRMLAENYMDKRDTKKALHYYKKINSIIPKSGYYKFQLYRAYKYAGQLENSLKTLKELIALEPSFLNNYYNLGLLYIDLKQYNKAKKAFEKLLKDKGFAFKGHVGLANLYLHLNDLKNCKKEIDKALSYKKRSYDLEKIVNIYKEKEKERKRNIFKFLFISFILIFLLLFILWFLILYKKNDQILQIQKKFNLGQENIYDLNQLTLYILNFFKDLSSAQEGILFLYSRQNNKLFVNNAIVENNYSQIMSISIVTNIGITNWLMNLNKYFLHLDELATKEFETIFPSLRGRLNEIGINYLIVLTDKKVLKGVVGLKVDKSLKFLERIYFNDLFSSLSSLAAQSIESLFLYETSMTDELTSLYNKRYFRQLLTVELKRADRYKQPCSLIEFDIDNFKRINDRFGHPQGDVVLKEIASILRECIRDGIDIPARTGGEEFFVILPSTDPESAKVAAERIRESVQDHSFPGFPGPYKVTISIGVATYPIMAKNEMDLIKRTDEALYIAKSTGKNKVVLAEGKEVDISKLNVKGRAEDDLTFIDKRTNLYKKSYFMLRWKDEIKRAKRYKSSCSLVFMRILSLMDENKHNKLLFVTGDLIRKYLRIGIDTPSYLGNNIIGIILPETASENASLVAYRLKDKIFSINEQEFKPDLTTLEVTISIANFPEDGIDADELFNIAKDKLNK